MLQELEQVENRVDEKGNPSGGHVKALGISIKWQNGPLGRHALDCQENDPAYEGCSKSCTRVPPNGAFVEGVILSAITRLRFFESAAEGKFSCEDNREALEHLDLALGALSRRTTKREERAVEGTHTA